MKLSPVAFVAALALALSVPAAALAQSRTVTKQAQTKQKKSAKDDDSGYVPGAAALEGQIMAPCCWMQTIDIHQSAIAIKLRHEVRRRLRAGESPASIKADLVRRYGKRILAVPPDSPLKSVAIFMSLAMGLAGVGAVGLLVHWRRRGGEEAPKDPDGDDGPDAKAEAAEPDDLDARIDDELERL